MASRKGDPLPSLVEKGFPLLRGEPFAPLFRLFGHVLCTPFRPREVRILPAPAVGADVRFRADERAWVLDDGADSRIQLVRRNGFGEKFADAGIAASTTRFASVCAVSMITGTKGSGLSVSVRNRRTNSSPSMGDICQLQTMMSAA